MSDRNTKRSVGAPFYAPPRRKTSAEIISEARAAIYAADAPGSGAGALRALRTRRPFTPRDPQRTLFTDRGKKKEQRPPSAFNLKNLSFDEAGEEFRYDSRSQSVDEDSLKAFLQADKQNSQARKNAMRTQSRSFPGSNENWSAFAKLPNLNANGRSKPLHRRNTTQGRDDDCTSDSNLSIAISVTQPLGGSERRSSTKSGDVHNKSLTPDNGSKSKSSNSKSTSEKKGNGLLGDVPVRHLAVQLPNTSSSDKYEGLSVLEIAEALSQKSRDVDKILLLMEMLQNALEEFPPANSLRELTLRSLYTHIDLEDVRITVAIARALLTMRVTGPHLVMACKLVFTVARNDKNDNFFRSTNLLELLVEGCGRAEPTTESECCVYGAGALRFLALEPKLRALAHKAGALHLAALHLKILNNAKVENPRNASEQWSHALYQLTGALRNLAGSGGRETKSFVASGALAELLSALTLYQTDRDVLTNVVRCLSVLSAEESCCAWMCACLGSTSALTRALAAVASRAPLALRLAYVLGNMAATDHHARTNIYNEEGAMDVLLMILESYSQKNDRDTRDGEGDPDLHLVGSDLSGSDGSNEDVLIKTVRVIANLCLAEQVGRSIAQLHLERTVRALMGCLQLAEKSRGNVTDLKDFEGEDKTAVERREELATAVLATLNNVTFYREPPEPPDPLSALMEKLCKVTCHWLSGPALSACEAVRALGNLSRSPEIAQLIVLDGALENLTPFLSHEEESIRCASAGVLVNVCGASGSPAAADVTCHALTVASSHRDSNTAALLARALWNATTHRPLSKTALQEATKALDLFIDDESVFAACEASRQRSSSDPDISKQHVAFELEEEMNHHKTGLSQRAYSVDQDLNLSGDEEAVQSGEDLGYEEGDGFTDYGCECGPCKRLASWEELVSVAIPLLEKLSPHRTDAAVGTD